MEEKTRNFDEEFERVYREICENCESKLQKNRNKLNKFLLIVFLVLTALNIMVYFIANEKTKVVGSLTITFCIMLFLVIQGREIYKKSYKNNVISALVKAYNSKLNYNPKIGFSRYDYTMSNFDSKFDEFFSEDQIHGTLDNGTRIKVAEVVTTVIHKEENDDGTTRTNKTETYRGMYGAIKMPFSISSQIFIYNDSITHRYSGNRIEVDSAEFEKYYDCFSSEKVKALRIFTADLIEKFNEIRRNSKYEFELKVEDNMIYFRYKCGQLFEPPTFGTGLDKELMKKYYRFIYYPLEIIKCIADNAKEVIE